MENEDTEANKKKFYHPYDPYDIQIDFMKALNETLTGGYKIGIFESPTGTGKTLSLICSTMSWLRSRRTESEEANDEDDDDEPAWIKESYSNLLSKKNNDAAQAYEAHLTEIANNSKIRQVQVLKESNKKFKRFKKIDAEVQEEDSFLPNDYNSDGDDELNSQRAENLKEKNDALNSEIQKLLKNIDRKDKDEAEGLSKDVKIFFSSRTHSQLNQFSSQLRLPNFPSLVDHQEEHLKYLPLGSRKQLCIHEKVSQLKDVSLLNEACLDMQKQDSKKKCDFYFTQKDMEKQDRAIEFRDTLFSKIHDIEDLNTIGKDFGVCPYYSVRKGIPIAEVVTLPYQLLLQKSSREALKISIKDCVVVIDEAHNLLDTIISLHSVSVSIDDFTVCKQALKKYLSKFSRKLNGGNRINIMKLVKIIDIFLKYVESCGKISPGKEINLLDVFQGTTGDLLNIKKLEKYLTVSKIAFKIESYMEKENQSSTPTLFKVVEFLKAVSNPSREGKFFFDLKNHVTSLNYMLLDPSEVFKEIVEDARCVVLAGGTMEPIDDYTNYLFPYIDESKIKKFTCGHVIPKENLDVFVVGGKTREFDFSFDKRNDSVMIKDLGSAILSLIKTIPAGVVIFFPSYKFLSDIVNVWKSCSVWDDLNNVKQVFSESSSNNILVDYSLAISQGKGAVLLSVVGGRLSEGINFSDDLARAVMMVGLPFPNVFSGELISRRKYIEEQVWSKTGNRNLAQEATKVFYENICMRAVNQSVGRSIRHKGDYSTIYFFDKRYHTSRIKLKLSNWIKERINDSVSFDQVVLKTVDFFQNRN